MPWRADDPARSIGRIEAVRPVADILADTVREFEAAVAGLPR